MPFDARTRDEIRDTLLADWQARYAAAGKTLDATALAHHHRLASGLAMICSLYDAMGVGLGDEILPDKATYTVRRHAAVEGLAPDPAVAAILGVSVTGTPSAVLNLTGKTLQSDDGTTYDASQNSDGTGSTVTLDGSGNATVYATCRTAGAVGNRPNSAILSWGNGAPTGANPTASVATTFRSGAEAETDSQLAARVIARRQERPASGNRADWRAWALDVLAAGSDAVVYPLLHPSLGTPILGAVTVVCIGPPQGASATNTRVLGVPTGAVASYIEGTTDAAGNALPVEKQKQLRPVTMAAGDYSIEAPLTNQQDLTVQIVLGAAYMPSWNSGFAVLVSPAPSTTTFSIAGDQTATLRPSGTPLPILVNLGTSAYRGGYCLVTPSSIVFNGGTGNTDIVVSTAMVAAPIVGSVILPPPLNWSQIQAATFNYFDTLGPGDTSPASRWPTQEQKLRATFYKPAIEAALVQTLDASGRVVAGVPGVLSAVVIVPATSIAPAAKTIVTLGTLTVSIV